MPSRETQGYILSFRCINCGRHEALARYPTGSIEREEEIRARIYHVSCSSCGWNGDACGVSAINISHSMEPEARVHDRAFRKAAHSG
jgi:Fe-S-cluster-containing hydrogenase component 2